MLSDSKKDGGSNLTSWECVLQRHTFLFIVHLGRDCKRIVMQVRISYSHIYKIKKFENLWNKKNRNTQPEIEERRDIG